MRSLIEGLETRRLLSGMPAPGDIVNVEWGGQTVEAAAGEWIVSLERPVTVRDADGDIVSTTRVSSHSAVPNARIAPSLANLADRGVQFKKYLGSEHIFLVSLPTTLSHSEVVAAMSEVPGFVRATPNAVECAYATVPNDTDYTEQWALNNSGQQYYNRYGQLVSGTPDADIDAPEAWDLTTGSSSVVVAVLDTGVNYNHPDLAGNMWTNTRETAGNDTLDGYSGDDVIYGQGGNDTIYGQGGADYLDGGTLDDWISGSTGTDSIHGQDGNDTLYAGTGSDYVRGEAGNDVFHTSGDTGYIDTGSGDEGTDDILDIDSFDTITQD